MYLLLYRKTAQLLMLAKLLFFHPASRRHITFQAVKHLVRVVINMLGQVDTFLAQNDVAVVFRIKIDDFGDFVTNVAVGDGDFDACRDIYLICFQKFALCIMFLWLDLKKRTNRAEAFSI